MDKNNFCNYFNYIARYWRNYTRCKLSDFKIGSCQSSILRFLYHEGEGVSHEEICRKLELNTTTASRALKKLKEAGYVKEIKDKKDNRVKRIFLTDKSRKLGECVEDAKNDLMDVILKGISDKELESFMAVLEKMYDSIKKENREEKVHG
jgi:DNA-binding MarR family transcriptional regulator